MKKFWVTRYKLLQFMVMCLALTFFVNEAEAQVACSASLAGRMYWTSPYLQTCDGTNWLNIVKANSSGYVGIGTTSPAYPLTVSGNTGSMAWVTSTSAVTNVNIDNTNTGVSATRYLNNGSAKWTVGNNGAHSDSFLISGSDQLGLRDFFYINRTTGNVGIGTTAPAAPLEVVSNDNAFATTLEVYNSNTGANAQAKIILVQGSNAADIFLGGNDLWLWNGVSGGPISFDVNNGGTQTQAMTILSSGNVGINTTSPSYTLHVVGTAGLSTGTAWTNASDARLKDIHGDYEYGLDEILKLHTVRFNYKKDNPLKLPSDKPMTGFIAQEVQKVIPDAISMNKNGYLELNADPIHWAVVNAVKELHGLYQELKNRLDAVYERLAGHDSAIANLTAESTAKDQRIDKLEQENNQLRQENIAVKTYLCGKDPAAGFCH